MPKPTVLLGEGSRAGMLRGFASIGRVLALTLGPTGGSIVHKQNGVGKVEVLRDAATAVQRITQLPDPRQDPGAMLMRHIVWQTRQQVGDGGATAAVIASAAAQEMQRAIVAGANAMVVRRGVGQALTVAIEALEALAVPLEGEDRIAAVAGAAIGDGQIGQLLGEIYDVLGPHANIEIIPYVATSHDRAYREGACFPAGYASPYLLTDPVRRRATLTDAYVLAADMSFDTAQSAANLLEQVVQGGGKSLLLICKQCSDRAVGVFAANNAHGTCLSSVAILRPFGHTRWGMFENIASLTGGQPLSDKMGIGSEGITLSSMGRAQRAIVEKDGVTIIGGRGNRAAIADRMNMLKQRARAATDAQERQLCHDLLAHLTQGVAELRLGGLTEQEREQAIGAAERAIQTVRAGLQSGLVPGGGAAYLACLPALCELSLEGDEAFGAQILASALQEPLRRIAINAQVQPAWAIAEAQGRGAGYGLDARTGQIVNMLAEGIADPAAVARCALEHGVNGAMLLLTTDALVIHRKPKGSVEP